MRLPVLSSIHFTGPLEQDRGQDRADVAGVDRHLVAEAAADVGRDDPDHLLGDLGHHRDRGADDVRRLGGHVDGELGGGPVEVGDRAAALDRRRVAARVVAAPAWRPRRPARRPGRCPPCRRPPSCRRRCRPGSTLSSRITGASGASPCHGFTMTRQRLVVDLDRLARVLGDVRVVGDDAGHLLALEPHLVGGQHRLGVVGQGGHPGEVPGRHHLAGQHQVDAGDAPRPCWCRST